MNHYRATVLTPLLVGQGEKLAPIDYMVWKDQVNVLDQRRIFKLLAKGSRLDSYLSQIRRAEKLDFASWGGYAQNYALRRIPLEDPSLAAVHQRERAENLFIPTFASSARGFFLPASALKGVLRTAWLASEWKETAAEQWSARIQGDRMVRHPGALLEQALAGDGGQRIRSLSLADSDPVQGECTKVYLLRTSTLIERGGKLEGGWKASPGRAIEARRAEESTPLLAEMAAPGTAFQGVWQVPASMRSPSTLKMLRMRAPVAPAAFCQAMNGLSGALLAQQREYVRTAGLADVERTVEALTRRLEQVRDLPQSCLVCLGWAGGYLTKTLLAPGSMEPLRQALRTHPLYSSAIRTGLPFPKTRRIVFLRGRPASLPGWVQLDFLED
jgi:CRISPR-associated protein Csm5